MEIVFRATFIFFFLWVLSRGMGKRELSELTAFELLVLVTLGDLVQQGVTQEDMSVTGAVLAVGTMGFWALVFSYLAFRFGKARRLLQGVPVVVVRDGRILHDVLRLERVPVDELHEVARNQGIGDLADVRLAVLEPDGKFSFIQASGEQHEEGREKHLS
jgi:uncharacterized membrane protein YcaP (DUF421 family)